MSFVVNIFVWLFLSLVSSTQVLKFEDCHFKPDLSSTQEDPVLSIELDENEELFAPPGDSLFKRIFVFILALPK